MKNVFGRLKRFADDQRMMLKDIHANQLMINLASKGAYFPITGSSLNMHSLATVINDIVINKRQSIIEFGSGLSTLFIARLIRELSLTTSFVSVDDNRVWLDIMQDRLSDESLSELVTMVFAPLKTSANSLDSLKWYDEDAITAQTQNIAMFDVILVDGPMAWEPSKGTARYPALKYISSRLGDPCSVFLDDVDRTGEQEILRLWRQQFGLEFRNVNPVFAMATKGDSFNPVV